MKQEEIYSILLNHANSRQESEALKSLYKQFYQRARAIVLKNGLGEEDARFIFNDGLLEILIRIRKNQWTFQEDGLVRFILRYCRFKSLSMAREKKKFTYNLPFDLHEENDRVSELDQEKLLEKIYEIAGETGAKRLKERFIKGHNYTFLGESQRITAQSYKNGIYRIVNKIRQENINLEDYLSN